MDTPIIRNTSNSKSVFILGSSRSDGETKSIIDFVNENNQFEVIDLNNFDISYFDYEHKNQGDDFIPLMEKIINNYDHMIFATPVYWYMMSAVMKCFFDRITDLITLRKELGRKLRGKEMSVLSCSGGNDLDKAFIQPFKASAEYLGMNFRGHQHSWLEEGQINDQLKKDLYEFAKKLSV